MIGHVVSKQETPEEWGEFLGLWFELRESGLHRRLTRYYSREAQDAEELEVRRWINEDGSKRELGGFLVGDVTVTGNPAIDARTVIVNSSISCFDDDRRGSIDRSWIEDSEVVMDGRVYECSVYRSLVKENVSVERFEIVESHVLHCTDIRRCFVYQSKTDSTQGKDSEFRRSFASFSEVKHCSLEDSIVRLSEVSDVSAGGLPSYPCVVVGTRLYSEKKAVGVKSHQVELKSGTSIIEKPFTGAGGDLVDMPLPKGVPEGLYHAKGCLLALSSGGNQAVLGFDLDHGSVRVGIDEDVPAWFWAQVNEIADGLRSKVAAAKAIEGRDGTDEKMQIKQERLRQELVDAVKEVEDWVEVHAGKN